MARSLTGTVLRRFDIIAANSQVVEFQMGRAIKVEDAMRTRIEQCAPLAPVAWDGEIPPDSKSLPLLHPSEGY